MRIGLPSALIINILNTTGSGTMSLKGTNYTFVPANKNPAENGQAFLDAYEAASQATPNGEPLSADNRFTLFLGAGYYETAGYTFDADFVDISSLNGERNIFLSHSAAYNFHANDAVYIGLKSLNSLITLSDDDQDNIVFKNCEHVSLTAASNIIGWRVGSSGILSGTFIDCEVSGGGRGFTAGSGGIIKGTFIRCKAGDMSFGGLGGAITAPTIVTGYFEDCIAGNQSFGGAREAAGRTSPLTSTSRGTFIRCKAGELSFGYVNSGTNGYLLGTYIDCETEGMSFGSNPNNELNFIGGEFRNCRIINPSEDVDGNGVPVHFKSVIHKGSVDNCILEKGEFPDPENGGNVVLSRENKTQVTTKYAPTDAFLVDVIDLHKQAVDSFTLTPANGGSVITESLYHSPTANPALLPKVFLATPGTYDLVVSKSGFQNHEEQITITDEDVVIEIPVLQEEV